MSDPRDYLCLALDTEDADQARRMSETLGESILWHKVGSALAVQGGEALIRDLKAAGKKVFLDYKFHDIDQTVANAVSGAVRLGVDLLTVHAVAPVVRAASTAKGNSDTKIVAVTVLTSMDESDLKAEGWSDGAPALVRSRAQTAINEGADGVVASAQEAKMLRDILPPSTFIVTPGIRPAGGDAQDQKRISTPASAIRDGSNLLVVGRPILQANDPKGAANAILEEIAGALN
ncbi:MAG: orotidine-5'-phosphate decarboxylase [Alphaproteobacteria bacterium]|jgi:orotidine-5'-phosphate decarboxylase